MDLVLVFTKSCYMILQLVYACSFILDSDPHANSLVTFEATKN